VNPVPNRSPHWWQWPTIISLDAPLIAVLWQWLFARTVNTEWRADHAFILGASVWLAYAADRWFEGWRLAPDQMRTQRHRFYQRHRWQVAVVWAAVLIADVGVAVRRLHHLEFIAGLLLLAPVLAYLLSHQLIHRTRRWRPPKEVCVAGLLAGGVALFPAVQPAASVRFLAAPLGLFAMLCFANCALISVWEKEIDATHRQTSLAHQFARGAALSQSLPWMLTLIAVLAALVEVGPARIAALCALVSSVALGIVDRLEPRLGWQLSRVLADAALMTPLFPLLAIASSRS